MDEAKGIGKTFVIGDIHGAYRALRQCLERSAFDYMHDRLICLGDVCDGWPETKRCVDELLKIQNLTFILGNHDLCALQWMSGGKADESWRLQGGESTIRSYHEGLPKEHFTFFRKALPYYLHHQKLFVHAGIDPHRLLANQSLQTFLWDRSLAQTALDHHARKETTHLTQFEEVYLGHTPIAHPEPLYSGGVWLMDTGAGWSGVLSLMDIESKVVYASDTVPGLYPNEKGRQVL